MFHSVNQIKVDGKGRIALPTRFREELDERCGGSMMVTVNLTGERCLWLYPMDEWDQVAKKVNALSSFKPQHAKLKRYFIGYASNVSLDKTGRLLLPPSLREFAHIDKEACIVGQGQKFEIWNATDWNAGCLDWQDHPDTAEPTPEMEVMQL